MESFLQRNLDARDDVNKVCFGLDARAKTTYLIVKEMWAMERNHAQYLRVICVDFKATSQEEAATSEKKSRELNKIIECLPQLFAFSEELVAEFELRLRNWRSNPRIADILVRKEAFFGLLSKYARNFAMQSCLFDHYRDLYPRFDEIVTQFELSGRCKQHIIVCRVLCCNRYLEWLNTQ